MRTRRVQKLEIVATCSISSNVRGLDELLLKYKFLVVFVSDVGGRLVGSSVRVQCGYEDTHHFVSERL